MKKKTHRHSKTERFQRVPIFSQYLNEGEVARILAITEEVSYKADQRILSPGDPSSDGFFIILNGRVEIRVPTGDGGYNRVAALSNRSVFGEMSFLGNRPRSAWVVATVATRLSRIDGTSFRTLLDDGDLAAYKVVHNFAQLISTRLRQVEKDLFEVLGELGGSKREAKLAELQEFREKLFSEWSF